MLYRTFAESDVVGVSQRYGSPQGGLRLAGPIAGGGGRPMGVGKAYAIQAGREIRVMVEQEKVDDAQATELAEEIAQKIQAEMEYPGQIKVTVIREVRAVGYAK